MKGKKLLTIVLTLCMLLSLLSLLPVPALAVEGDVAMIGETGYPTLGAAITAARAGEDKVITVIGEVPSHVFTNANMDGITIQGSETGKITGSFTATGSTNSFVGTVFENLKFENASIILSTAVTNFAGLTIRDCTFMGHTAGVYGSIHFQMPASAPYDGLTITGNTIIHDGTEDTACGIRISGGGNTNSGSITISDNAVSDADNNALQLHQFPNATNVSISGNTFNSNRGACVSLYNTIASGAFVITDNLISSDNGRLLGYVSDNITATGNTWSHVVDGTPEQLSDPSEIMDNIGFSENAAGSVVTLFNAARIGDQEYATLAEAVAAAQDGDTITLLVDLSDQTVSLTKPNVGYTLDLNQKTLEMKPTGYLLNVPNEKTITIKNGTMNVDGTNLPQYSSSCEYLIGLTNASSALNLDNVDFTVTNVSKPDDSQRDWYVFNLDAGSVNLTNGTKLSFSDLAKAFYAPAIQTAEINVKDSEISFEGILNMCFHCDRVMLDNGKITVTDSENAGVFVHSGLTATNNSVVTIDNVYRTFSGSDMAHGECLVMDATSSITETNTEAVSITGDVTVPSGADISLDSDLEIYGTAAIADGRYKGTIAKGADAASISITGGTFSVDPSEYVASGYVVNMVSGKYVVSKQPPTSGGGSTPPTVTVPVSSDSGSANVSASISGTAVTVSITDQDLSQVIASAGNTGNVVIDVSGLNNVTSAVIPSKVITAVNGAEDATGLTVALPGGSVGLDSDALAAVAAAAGGADVTMSVETVDTSKLSESQQAVLGNQISNAIVVDVSIMAQGTAISSFDGGTVTISVPYEPEEGTDTSKLVVWYLADDGTISPVEGAYDPATKSFVFKTSHLSTYALVSFPFEDVTAGSWYYGNVAYVFNNNLFNGTSSSTFSPDDTMTRAMLMTVLARMAGQDTAVEDGVWYEKGMNWAVENGISDGTNPEGSITREQLVTMLYRYAGSPEASGDLSAFSDADKVDGYATLAMQWAVGKGLINGMGDGTLAPRDTATRAQVAAILMRFCENIIA